MEDFKEQLTRAFDLRGLQEDTRRSYTGYVSRLSKFHGGRHPQELNTDDIRAYFEHLGRTVCLSASTLGVCYAALGYYYRHVVQRPEVMAPIPRRKRHRKIARVPPPELVSLAGFNFLAQSVAPSVGGFLVVLVLLFPHEFHE